MVPSPIGGCLWPSPGRAHFGGVGAATGGGAAFYTWNLRSSPGVSAMPPGCCLLFDNIWAGEKRHWHGILGSSLEWRGNWRILGAGSFPHLPCSSKGHPWISQWEWTASFSLWITLLLLFPWSPVELLLGLIAHLSKLPRGDRKARMFTTFPDLILFQGHGSLAAGSQQSCVHTLQQFCDQIWA